MRSCEVRGNLPSIDMKNAKTLTEAFALLAAGYKPFAGGTDLMVVFEAGQLKEKKFFNILEIAELKGIIVGKDEITLRALTTFSDIQRNEILQKEFPMLCEAARETGAIAIQNRGTIGGNIANASPAADSPPALLAYDAEIELVSSSGKRRLPYLEFHKSYKVTEMRPNELIFSIILPRTTKGAHQQYRKVGTRKAQAISKTCFAGFAKKDGQTLSEIRIAYGSIAATPIRCKNTEALLWRKKLDATLIAQAKMMLLTEITPIDDIRSTQEYRRAVSANLLEDFLTSL